LAAHRVVICVGAGGVGKTTVSAAIALGLAAEGNRVALVTIDPARRLAEALGLDRLDNNPRPVDPGPLTTAGLAVKGELWAMMLDARCTFDELIARLAPDPWTCEEILHNRVYQHLTGAVAGSHEYAAVAKLSEIERTGEFDVLVLDTPPSRNALDFLHAPERLGGLLEGGALRVLLAPTGYSARAAGVVVAALRRVTGSGLLEDLAAFLGLLGGILDGLRARSVDVKRLLREPSTGFVIVTSPESAPVQEAIFLAGELDRAGLHRCGTIVNRTHSGAAQRGISGTVARLEPALGRELAAKVARAHAEVQLLAKRDAAARERLKLALGDEQPICLRDRARDVHDIGDLVEVQRELFGGPRMSAERSPGAAPVAGASFRRGWAS
jgi:anion-transporting  ArsA/GET3 family ATPase